MKTITNKRYGESYVEAGVRKVLVHDGYSIGGNGYEAGE